VQAHHIADPQWQRQPIFMEARLDETVHGILISCEKATELGNHRGIRSFMCYWYEDGISNNHHDLFVVSDELECDMVIGQERFEDIERGRRETIAPIDQGQSSQQRRETQRRVDSQRNRSRNTRDNQTTQYLDHIRESRVNRQAQTDQLIQEVWDDRMRTWWREMREWNG
jgi:hypothetical protein